MRYIEVISVYPEIHINDISKPCRQMAELLDVEPIGAYNPYYAL
jgi:hypothetical protein